MSDKVVTFLGEFMHEGIQSSLDARGLRYSKHALYRRAPAAWSRRADRMNASLERGELTGVVLYLPTPVVLLGSEPEYEEPWKKLLAVASRTKSIAFVYADNLTGEFRPRNFETGEPITLGQLRMRSARYEKEGWDPRKIDLTLERVEKAEIYRERIANFLQCLFSTSIEVCPFWKRSDTTVRIEQFLEDIDQEIFLRLYVPDNRFQAEQLAAFLRTFERYIRQVEEMEFSIETRRTATGTIYVFRGKIDKKGIESLEAAIARFDEFMKMCRDDPKRASSILTKPGIDPAEVSFLVARYSRDYQRIILDAKHELEQKTLILSQKLELDLINAPSDRVSGDVESKGPSVLLNIAGNTGPVTIKLDQSSITQQRTATEIVGNVINAGVVYNENDEAIVKMIEARSTRLEAVQLKSDLDQFKDRTTAPDQRKTAGQRLAGFLYKVAGTAADEITKASIRLLIEYVMNGGVGAI